MRWGDLQGEITKIGTPLEWAEMSSSGIRKAKDLTHNIQEGAVRSTPRESIIDLWINLKAYFLLYVYISENYVFQCSLLGILIFYAPW